MKSIDAFISYASEDLEFAQKLAERLRDEGVKIWFDKWEIKAGDHVTIKINDGLENFHTMIAVLTPNYFKNDKIWTQAESFAQLYSGILAGKGPLIPVLYKKYDDIPRLFQPVKSIDFSIKEDFDLKFCQLLEALDFFT